MVTRKKAGKKRQTANQKAYSSEYTKARRRITQAVNRAKKRGYKFELTGSQIADKIFKEAGITKTPKRATKKKIESLKKLGSNSVYSFSYKDAYKSRAKIPGTVAREMERRARAKKAADTRARNKAKKTGSNLPKETDITRPNVKANFFGTFDEFIDTLWQLFPGRRSNPVGVGIIEDSLGAIIGSKVDIENQIIEIVNDLYNTGNQITPSIAYMGDLAMRWVELVISRLNLSDEEKAEISEEMNGIVGEFFREF